VKIVGGLCFLWYVAATVASILKCVPVKKAWNPRMPGNCYDFQAFYIGIEIPNCILDFFIVFLPIGVLKGIQLPRRHKISISMIFILGGL